jgi:hypothetical protein
VDVRLCCAFHQPQETVQICIGQNYFANPNQHFTALSERYSQIWLKSSCRWLPTQLPHKFGEKKNNDGITNMLQALV